MSKTRACLWLQRIVIAIGLMGVGAGLNQHSANLEYVAIQQGAADRAFAKGTWQTFARCWNLYAVKADR